MILPSKFKVIGFDMLDELLILFRLLEPLVRLIGDRVL